MQNFFLTTAQYDLFYKFFYNNVQNIPKLKKVVLSFTLKTDVNLKILAAQLVALELLSLQKATLIKTKTFNLKIRKGAPIGCKLTLRKKYLYFFFTKILLEYFPNLKQPEIYKLKKKYKKEKTLSFNLKKLLVFSELNSQYHIFNKLNNLQIIIVSNSQSFSEFYFILKLHKIPVILK